jgi:hypothetical protein
LQRERAGNGRKDDKLGLGAEQVAAGVALGVEVDDEGPAAAARLTVIVALPTPPFWLNTTVRMEGSGYDGRGSESPPCGDRSVAGIRTAGDAGMSPA